MSALKARVAALEEELAACKQSYMEHQQVAAVAVKHATQLMEDNMAATRKVHPPPPTTLYIRVCACLSFSRVFQHCLFIYHTTGVGGGIQDT
jgi:hypothetical protein